MKIDLPYVCEFCHIRCRSINRMDVRENEWESPSKALIMVCSTCRDDIMRLSAYVSSMQEEGYSVSIDLNGDTLETDDDFLRELWDSLRSQRRRF